MARTSWRLQAHWRVGDDERSYAPTYEHSRWRVRTTKREVTRSLSHFHDLRITVEPVDRAIAVAAEQERERSLASTPPPLLHLFDEAHVGPLCGVILGLPSVVMTLDMMELSTGERCAQCVALAKSLPATQ
jgi:hypothetical protein